jgi:hypothetical protein
MKPPDTANLIAGIALGVSALSAGAAYWAIRSSRKTAKEQTALQAKLTAIEEERHGKEVETAKHARVVPAFDDHRKFTITNHGAASAREVNVEVASLTAAEVPIIIGLEQALPIRVLHPGQVWTFDVGFHWQETDLMNAALRWVDEVGEQAQTYELHVPTRP